MQIIIYSLEKLFVLFYIKTLVKSMFYIISIRSVFSESILYKSVFRRITYKIFHHKTLQVIFYLYPNNFIFIFLRKRNL